MHTCANCGIKGNGKYCSECGQQYLVKRITMPVLLHEVVHTFTHFEKGFGYTLIQLATRPGTMQKKYLKGGRVRYQKPFSMFVICATITGVAFYLIVHSSVLTPLDEARQHFFRHYFVFLQAALLPFYSLVLWLFFYSKKVYYAEILTMQAYTLGFSLLLIIPVDLLGTIIKNFPTDLMEVIFVTTYAIWTNLNFFDTQPTWLIVIKSVVILMICWYTSILMAARVEHWLV
jgi:hypothetical protein